MALFGKTTADVVEEALEEQVLEGIAQEDPEEVKETSELYHAAENVVDDYYDFKKTAKERDQEVLGQQVEYLSDLATGAVTWPVYAASEVVETAVEGVGDVYGQSIESGGDLGRKVIEQRYDGKIAREKGEQRLEEVRAS